MPDTRNDWPRFRSPLLEAVAAAFTSRRQAIRHHTRSFGLSRQPERIEVEPPERLDVDLSTLEDRPVRVHLRIWPDGGLWFWAGRSTKRGWQFEVSFHGWLSEARPAGVVSKFEESLAILHGATAAEACIKPLLDVWQDVSPELERAV